MRVLVFCLVALLPAVFASITGLSSTVNGFTGTTSAADLNGFAIRFQGMSSNIASTAFTVTAGDAGAFTVTNLNTGRYSVSDDNGANWVNVSTDCLTPDVPPITLNTQASSTAVPNGGSRLRLHLQFLENHRYYSITYKYQGATANCNSSVSSTTDETFQSWVRTADATACASSRTDYNQDFNNALATCNYYRDETNADLTVFNATIIITTVDTGIVIRGSRYERTLDTAVVIKIAFQTNVSAVANNPSIFGNRITYSAVTQQLWDTATFTATVTVITSVQWPYQLYQTGFTETNSQAATWAVMTSVASAQDGTNHFFTGGQQRSVCYSSTGATATGATAQTYGQICNQYWTITLRRAATCSGSNSLDLSGNWKIDFGVTCSDIFNGSCATPNPGTDFIEFFTNSTNYCPQLIDNNNLNTAVLTTYQDNAYSVPQNQYVFGTTTYFEATITSPILISDVVVETVYLTAGGTLSATTPYYSRPFTNAADYFSSSSLEAAGSGTYGTCGTVAVSSATEGAAMTVTDNVRHTGQDSVNQFTKYVRFSLLWNPCSSAATGDNPMPTTVQVNIRIRYTNQNAPAAPAAKLISLSKTFAGVESGTASTTIGVTQGSAISGNAASTSSSSAMTVVGVVAGVVGVTALLVGMTVYMLRRNRSGKTEQQVASVQLQSSP